MNIFKKDLYKKTFSEIPGLQNKSVVIYKVIKTNLQDEIYYGIEVSKNENSLEKNFCEKFISKNKERVVNIVTFLYENSVDIDLCSSVISDVNKIHKSPKNSCPS